MSTKTPDTSPGFSITPDMKIKIPFAYLLSAFVVAIGCTVTIVTTLLNTKNETKRNFEVLSDKIENVQKEMKAQGSRAWLYEEQVSWVTALDKEFRRSEYNIPPATKFRSTP